MLPLYKLALQRESARRVNCLLQVFKLFTSSCEVTNSLSIPLISPCILLICLLGSDSEACIFYLKVEGGGFGSKRSKQVISVGSSQWFKQGSQGSLPFGWKLPFQSALFKGIGLCKLMRSLSTICKTSYYNSIVWQCVCSCVLVSVWAGFWLQFWMCQ